MKAHLITIGDELLIGQVVNTNAAWLGEQLNALGVEVCRTIMLGDEVTAIHEELDRALPTADLVLLTGGLGPTHDDVTRTALTAYFDTTLRFDEHIFEPIQERYARRGRIPPEHARSLAMVPISFEALPNPVGAAPALWYQDEREGRECIVVALPGVPQELEALVREQVVPRLRRHHKLRTIEQRTLLTAGIGESNLQAKIGDLSDRLGPNLRLAYLPGTNGVRMRLTARGERRADVRERLNALEAHIRNRVAPYIYGTDDDSLEAVVGAMLNERKLTIAVAESCTGGLLGHRITNVPGSSAYMVGGVVAYSNRVKVRQLGVDAAVLDREGAVSEVVAQQMARGAREHLHADIAVSTTGIAGPSGGTADKPVGTVWIAYADAENEITKLLHLVKNRLLNKELTCTAVLDLVRRQLMDSA